VRLDAPVFDFPLLAVTGKLGERGERLGEDLFLRRRLDLEFELGGVLDPPVRQRAPFRV
jgi:hypothetical protein